MPKVTASADNRKLLRDLAWLAAQVERWPVGAPQRARFEARLWRERARQRKEEIRKIKAQDAARARAIKNEPWFIEMMAESDARAAELAEQRSRQAAIEADPVAKARQQHEYTRSVKRETPQQAARADQKLAIELRMLGEHVPLSKAEIEERVQEMKRSRESAARLAIAMGESHLVSAILSGQDLSRSSSPDNCPLACEDLSRERAAGKLKAERDEDPLSKDWEHAPEGTAQAYGWAVDRYCRGFTILADLLRSQILI